MTQNKTKENIQVMEEFMENFLKTELDKSVKEMLPPTLTGKFQELMAEQITKKVMDSWKSTDNTEKLNNILSKNTPSKSLTPRRKAFLKFKQEVLENSKDEPDKEILGYIKTLWKQLSPEEQNIYF
tara:strand:- start:125 stop:502 length:378 start_codon:yes stop_codon:yes gene_type:complete